MHWIRRIQERLSNRVHAQGDAFAEQTGWTTTKTAGRFGFGARVYRDPRFSQRQAPGNGGHPAHWSSQMTTLIAVPHSGSCQDRRDAVASAWAGHGFSRPGPGAEVPRDLVSGTTAHTLAARCYDVVP